MRFYYFIGTLLFIYVSISEAMMPKDKNSTISNLLTRVSKEDNFRMEVMMDNVDYFYSTSDPDPAFYLALDSDLGAQKRQEIMEYLKYVCLVKNKDTGN